MRGTVHKDGEELCAICSVTIVPCESPMCPRCGLPYTGTVGPDHLCDDCVKSPPPFAAARSAFLYGGAVHDMVSAFKYGRKLGAGGTLIRMALDSGAAGAVAEGADLAVPVPMHFLRLLRRGFNQSAEITRAVSKRHGLKYAPGILRRARRAHAQVGLKRREREVNLKGAFKVAHQRVVEGKRILLADDVMTTGATAAECARVLLDAGAAEVRVFTLARTA
ncbi:MAG: ComF family protein [Deltaproteobacteria bacterium]|nr:ComF family protein [Deltaproteobacteria bacterium]